MLQKLQQIKKRQEGFTIIEVLIVLAIAGLILLIVFLAVPALERSQKNSARKSDAGHISTAIGDYVTNNNGNVPKTTPTATWDTACGIILDDAGTLADYTSNNSFACGAATNAGTIDKFTSETGAITPTVAITGQAMVLDESATCPTSTGGATVAGTLDQIALLYTVDSGTTNWTWDCVQAQ